ncbi:hypothetical protein Tco_0905646, partial [Tanacetum coccineum]
MAVMICQKSLGYSNSPMIHVLRVGLFNKATKTANYMVLEDVLIKNKDVASSRDIQLICAEFSSIQVKTQADWMYVVPTGRVVVPTGRYVVLAGKVIIIVSPGRLSLVPTSRILSLELLNDYGLLACKLAATPLQQNIVFCFKESENDKYIANLTRVLRYLKQALGTGIQFNKGNKFSLHAFSDVNWAKCPKSRKSLL